MKRVLCLLISIVWLLIAALLAGACGGAASPAASIPLASQTAAASSTAQLSPQPSPTVPAATATAQPSATEPAASTGPRFRVGQTRPPGVPGLTPAPYAGTNAEISKAIDELLTKYDSLQKLSGAFRVELKGETVFERALGYADADQTQPITPQTRFRIGSVSKSMTAMAILLLQKQGKLNVQDPICKYITDCPVSWQPITVHQLLTHTSGIPHYPDLPDYYEWKKTPQTLDQMVARIKEFPLSFEPGSQFLYSNSAFVLASYIVERLAGMPFEQAMKQLVFTPLAMADTGLTDPGPQLAPGYNGRRPTADDEVVTNHYGAGGFYSTTSDLSRWAHAWMDGNGLPAELRDLARANHVQWAADDWYGYGIGSGTGGDRLGYGHGGWVAGYRAEWVFIPEDQIVIIVLVNNDVLDTQTLELGIEHRIFQQQ